MEPSQQEIGCEVASEMHVQILFVADAGCCWEGQGGWMVRRGTLGNDFVGC
jgi:hypothetical protein